jgi:hypothetical protein
MRPCEVCGAPGERHHIVFRSHGGLNIDVNYAYLCTWHNTQGPDAPHRNHWRDLLLKLRMQRDLENMLWAETYRAEEIAEIIGIGRRSLEKKMRRVPNEQGNYKREDIIKFLMGGKLYDRIGKGHKRSAASAAGFILLDSNRNAERSDAKGDTGAR